MSKCSVAPLLHNLRQRAYDTSRLTGKAGSAGGAADMYAKEAERVIMSGGNCDKAKEYVAMAESFLKKANRSARSSRSRKRR